MISILCKANHELEISHYVYIRLDELEALSEPSAWSNLKPLSPRVGEVFYTNDLGNKYLGQESENGLREGFGTMVYKEDGSIYSGTWKQNNKHGYGTYCFGRGESVGDFYRGEFYEDQQTGHGMYKYA